MTLGSRSSPAITSAGSPGNRCCSENIRIDTKNSVGISCTMRLAMKFSMADVDSRESRKAVATSTFPPPLRMREQLRCSMQPSSFQLQPDHAHQPVRHLLVTLKLVGVGDQESAVKDIKNRLFVEHELRQLLVDRLPLRLLRDKARVIERLIGLGVGPRAVVLRASAFEEDVGIAV